MVADVVRVSHLESTNGVFPVCFESFEVKQSSAIAVMGHTILHCSRGVNLSMVNDTKNTSSVHDVRSSVVTAGTNRHYSEMLSPERELLLIGIVGTSDRMLRLTNAIPSREANIAHPVSGKAEAHKRRVACALRQVDRGSIILGSTATLR